MGHRNCARQHGLHSTECDFKRIHQEGASHPIIIPELTKKNTKWMWMKGGAWLSLACLRLEIIPPVFLLSSLLVSLFVLPQDTVAVGVVIIWFLSVVSVVQFEKRESKPICMI